MTETKNSNMLLTAQNVQNLLCMLVGMKHIIYRIGICRDIEPELNRYV
jgi:hypothetical protein